MRYKNKRVLFIALRDRSLIGKVFDTILRERSTIFSQQRADLRVIATKI